MIERRNIESSPYKEYQDKALALIQELCGEIWTNFNEHDPGVTILDIVNYALLELQYSLKFPFESYISEDNKIDFELMGLFPAGTLFSRSPVTVEDYGRLIEEKIEEVVSCSFTLLPGRRYLIEAKISVPDNETSEVRRLLTEKIERLYHSKRNLCETLDSIILLKEVTGVKNERPGFRMGLQYDAAQERRKNEQVLFSAEHYSVQNHFPDCYGINEKGIPAGADLITRIKIKQLQGYLLIFDYLLANTRGRVSGMTKLFELSEEIPSGAVPDFKSGAIGQLVDTVRFDENNVNDTECVNVQKSYYLDMLDMLYGEDTKRFFPGEKDLRTLNRKRAELIRHFPYLNMIRYRSFDILKINEKNGESAGIVQFLSAINGRWPGKESSMINLFGRYNLRVLSDEDFFREYRNLNMNFVTDYIERNLFDYEVEPVPERTVEYDDSKYYLLRSFIYLFWHSVLFESFLTWGLDRANYRMAYWYKTNGYILIFYLPDRKEWLNLGLFPDKDTLIEAANLLFEFLKMFGRQSQLIFLVEHILLGQAPPDYNMLTLAIPYWVKFYFKPHVFESLLRERLPVHLEIRFKWLHAGETYYFEETYFSWREALASGDKERIESASALLREIINVEHI